MLFSSSFFIYFSIFSQFFKIKLLLSLIIYYFGFFFSLVYLFLFLFRDILSISYFVSVHFLFEGFSFRFNSTLYMDFPSFLK